MNYLRGNSLGWLVLGGVGVALLLWLMTTVAALQVIVGLLVVLVLPGFALTAALFKQHQLSWAERLLLSGGASIALVIVGSLLLKQSGMPLQPLYWVGLLVSVTLGAALVAWLGSQSQPDLEPGPRQVGLNSTHLVLLGLALFVTSVAFTTVRSAAPSQEYQGYTIFWLTPQAASASNRLQLGVTSKELTPTAYKVQIKVNDQLAQEWPQLLLAPHQLWQASIEMPVEQIAQSTVEAILYRLDQPETPYRQVVLRPNR